MIHNLERKKSFLEYREMYLQVVLIGLRTYAKTKDQKILDAVKALGRAYKEVEKSYRD